MAELQALLNEVTACEKRHDVVGLRAVRARIAEDHPDSDAATEALYKIGLDMLFRERQLAAAVEQFEAAAQRKQPFWSAAARTSLGLCYYHQRRLQKALFELRKVGYAKVPNVHSVTALAFIENIFSAEGQSEEASRVRRDRIAQLERVIEGHRAADGDASERGYYLHQLGIALKDSGEGGRASAVLEEAKGLGPQVLGADLYRSVIDALNH